MVFVWSRLTDGEPNFTLSQVALNDAIMVVAFAGGGPVVQGFRTMAKSANSRAERRLSDRQREG